MPHNNREHIKPTLRGKRKGQIITDGEKVNGQVVYGTWEWNGRRWIDITTDSDVFSRDEDVDKSSDNPSSSKNGVDIFDSELIDGDSNTKGSDLDTEDSDLKPDGENPLSLAPSIEITVKATKPSAIFIDGEDTLLQTSHTFNYTAKELLTPKIFTVKASESFISTDVYKVSAVQKEFGKGVEDLDLKNKKGLVKFSYYEFIILKNNKIFTEFTLDYDTLLENRAATLDFSIDTDGIVITPEPEKTLVVITSNVSSNDIIRYQTAPDNQTDFLLAEDEIELEVTSNVKDLNKFIQFYGVGIDDTTHTVEYTINTPNNRGGQTVTNIDSGKVLLQAGTTNITVDAIKIPRTDTPGIPLLNISSNQLVYNINGEELLQIPYRTTNADLVEYSIGSIKRQIGSSGSITLDTKDFTNGVGTYTLYAQARSSNGGSDVKKIIIVVESREYIPGPDITHINYPQNIKGADFKQFNVPFNVSWQSINTDYIRIYSGKYDVEAENNYYLGQFSESGVATFTVEDVLRNARREFSEDDNILQFKLLLVPFNSQGDTLTAGKIEEINITFDKGDLDLRRGDVIGDIRKAFEYCFDYSDFDEPTSPFLTHYLHLGDGDNKLISTYGIDDETFSEYEFVNDTNQRKKIKENKSIVLKLYEPLDNKIDVNDKIWISKIQSIPLIDQITILDDVTSDCIPLTPNLSLELNDDIGYQIYDDLVASGSTSSEAIIQEFVSGSGFSLDTLELEYTSGSTYQWENFVKYSSAKERVANFYYKIKLLESHRSKHELLSNATGSAGSVASKNEQKRILGKISEIKQNFDAFEKHLYTVNGSLQYPKNGSVVGDIKLTDTGSIVNPSDTAAVNWYNSIYTDAALYDRNSTERLVNNLPSHIQEDDKGQEFILFFDMIGQHFDILYHYIKRLSKSKKTENKFENGIINDLMYEMLSSLGWDADLGLSSETLWEYAFGEHSDGTEISSMSGKSRQEETWRRILNNLPYLYKHKGTKRAIHAALSIYGIPNSMLTIMEFGGPKDTTTSKLVKYTYDDSTSALNINGSKKLTLPWKVYNGSYPSAVEMRVETNTKQNQTILSSSGWSLDLNYTSGSNANLQLNVLSGSTNYSASTEDFPYFNQDYTQLVVNRITGSTTTFEVHAKEGFQERIRNAVSASVTVGNSNDWNSGSELIVGGDSSDFTGSIDEIRLWTTPLSESRIENHALNGDAIDGNHISSSTEDLLLRIDFEHPRNLNSTSDNWRNTIVSASMVSDGLTSVSGSIENISPNTSYANFITASNFPSASYPHGFTFYNRKNTSNVPSVGIAVGDKVRFEEQTLLSDLSYKNRATKKSYDTSPLDSDKLGLFFSPAKELNLDIVKTIGDFNIDDLIGDPSDYYQDSYSSLDSFRKYYFNRYNVDFHEYIQLVRYIDKSLFSLLESLVPARAKVTTGLLIEPHMLERSKIKRVKPTAENNKIEASINIQDNVVIESSKDNYLVELNLIEQSTISGSTNFYDVEIQEVINSNLVGTKDNYESIISASNTITPSGTITRNSGSDMGGFDIEIGAEFTQSVQGEYDSTAYQQIGMEPDSLTVAGFGLYGSGSNAIITKLDKNNNFVRERSKVFLLKEAYTINIPKNISSLDSSLGTEIESVTEYRHKLTILPFTGSDGNESTDPIVTGSIVEVKPLNGAFPTHYKNTGDLTSGMENSFFNGSKQTSATTLDGSSPVQSFTTNPNTLRVNESGRGSGEPILEVE